MEHISNAAAHSGDSPSTSSRFYRASLCIIFLYRHLQSALNSNAMCHSAADRRQLAVRYERRVGSARHLPRDGARAVHSAQYVERSLRRPACVPLQTARCRRPPASSLQPAAAYKSLRRVRGGTVPGLARRAALAPAG